MNRMVRGNSRGDRTDGTDDMLTGLVQPERQVYPDAAGGQIAITILRLFIDIHS